MRIVLSTRGRKMHARGAVRMPAEYLFRCRQRAGTGLGQRVTGIDQLPVCLRHGVAKPQEGRGEILRFVNQHGIVRVQIRSRPCASCWGHPCVQSRLTGSCELSAPAKGLPGRLKIVAFRPDDTAKSVVDSGSSASFQRSPRGKDLDMVPIRFSTAVPCEPTDQMPELGLKRSRTERDGYFPGRMPDMQVGCFQRHNDRFARTGHPPNALHPIHGLNHGLALLTVQMGHGCFPLRQFAASIISAPPSPADRSLADRDPRQQNGYQVCVTVWLRPIIQGVEPSRQAGSIADAATALRVRQVLDHRSESYGANRHLQRSSAHQAFMLAQPGLEFIGIFVLSVDKAVCRCALHQIEYDDSLLLGNEQSVYVMGTGRRVKRGISREEKPFRQRRARLENSYQRTGGNGFRG